MKKLVLKGRYSSFSNPALGSNIPIEMKRDIREDASWSYKGIPNSLWFKEQFDDFYHENKEKGDTLSSIDVFRKQLGYPTHPITQTLLEAETRKTINNAIRKTHKSVGWVESAMTTKAPSWPFGFPKLNKRIPLQNMSDEELIRKMFSKFNMAYVKYRHALEQHFRHNTGEDLDHRIDIWRATKITKKTPLIDVLKEKIKSTYQKGSLGIGSPIDVTRELGAAETLISFREGLLGMLDEVAAFGGIQQIELLGYLQNIELGGEYLDRYGKIHYKPTILEIRLEFILKDWFGVDEEDVYKNGKAVQLDRESIAAMWILQHQRGYKPFINVIHYDEIIRIVC